MLRPLSSPFFAEAMGDFLERRARQQYWAASDLVCWWCGQPIVCIEDIQPLTSWHTHNRFFHYNCWNAAYSLPATAIEAARAAAASNREGPTESNSAPAKPLPQPADTAASEAVCRICGGVLSGGLRPNSWTCEQCLPTETPSASSAGERTSAQVGPSVVLVSDSSEDL